MFDKKVFILLCTTTTNDRGRVTEDVLSFGLDAQVFGPSLEAYKSLKIPCSRLEDSIIF